MYDICHELYDECHLHLSAVKKLKLMSMAVEINLGKNDEMECKFLGTKIQMERRDIEEVVKLLYLGATVSTTGAAKEGIKAGLVKV